MTTLNGEKWSLDWSVEQPDTEYTYYYSVERDGIVCKTEWLLLKHRLDMTSTRCEDVTLYDHWKVIPEDAYLYSSAFTDCINHQAVAQMEPQNYSKVVRFIVRAPQLRDGESLGVIGSDNILGAWNSQKVIPMVQHSFCEWVVDIDASALQTNHLELKFVAINHKKTDSSGRQA